MTLNFSNKRALCVPAVEVCMLRLCEISVNVLPASSRETISNSFGDSLSKGLPALPDNESSASFSISDSLIYFLSLRIWLMA